MGAAVILTKRTYVQVLGCAPGPPGPDFFRKVVVLRTGNGFILQAYYCTRLRAEVVHYLESLKNYEA